MTTKEQERAALAKIEKIINDLGDDSYLGMTFAGTLELAEQNITDDAALNYKEMWENVTGNFSSYKVQSNAAIKSLEDEKANLQSQLDRYKVWYEQKASRIDELNEQINEAAADHSIINDKLYAAQDENKALKEEITILKAKLYDLMTA